MSVNLMYAPVKGEMCAGKGPLRDLLTKLFDRLPDELSEGDIPALTLAMKICEYENIKEELDKLIEAVEKFKRIRLWEEY